MLFRSAVLVIAAAFLSMLGTGCAVNPSAGAVLSQAVAPVQSQRPDPNAPYMVPAPPRPAAARSTADAHAPWCSADALKVQEISGNMHGNNHSTKLGFRNQTAVPCQLGGYPIVALFNGQGQSVGSIAVERITEAEVRAEFAESAPQPPGTPAAHPENSPKSAPSQTAGGSLPQVVLMPKEVAAFQVVWSAGQGCPSVARLLVTAPDTTRSFSVAQPMSVCGGRIQVTPLVLDQGDD